jgi:hypothetical protein
LRLKPSNGAANPAQHLRRLNRLHARERCFAPSLMARLTQLHDPENDRNDDGRGLDEIGKSRKIHAR